MKWTLWSFGVPILGIWDWQSYTCPSEPIRAGGATMVKNIPEGLAACVLAKAVSTGHGAEVCLTVTEGKHWGT